MKAYKEAKELLLELQRKNQHILLCKVEFLWSLSDCVLDSSNFPEFSGMGMEELLNNKKFKDLVDYVYEDFLKTQNNMVNGDDLSVATYMRYIYKKPL